MIHDPNWTDDDNENDADGRDKCPKLPARARLARKVHKEYELDEQLGNCENEDRCRQKVMWKNSVVGTDMDPNERRPRKRQHDWEHESYNVWL